MRSYILISTLFFTNSLFALNLPDRITCTKISSPYKLILVIRDAMLPENVGAIALKNGNAVIVKVAAHLYTITNQPLVGFSEIGNLTPKEVRLNLQNKSATLTSFEMSDLPDGTIFNCEF